MIWLSVLFFLWNLIYYVKLLIISYNANVVVRPFDDALRLLESIYTSNGLTPYKDFSFVYPPGQILFNTFFSIDISNQYKLFTLISAVLSITIITYILLRTKSFFAGGIVILLLVINFNVLTSPFAMALTILLTITLIEFFLTEKKVYLFLVACLGFILFQFRWEIPAAIDAILLCGLIFSKFIQKLNKKDVDKFLNLFCVLLASIFLSGIFLLVYLFAINSDVQNALYFIFVVPFKISPYRKLPFFSQDLISHGKIVYLFFLFLLPLLVKLLSKTKEKTLSGTDLLLVLLPFSFLPYALGRVGIPHSLPLITTLILVYSFYAWRKEKFFAISLFIMVLYVFHTFNIFTFPNAKPTDRFDSQVLDCKEKVKNLNFKSLFVGKTSYSRFVISYSSLYLVNPLKMPATSYISDEPGLQNNCQDGQIVAEQLESSTKPMLTFIETSEQKPEANLTGSMKSCMYIENWLKSHDFEKIGTCSVENAQFDIRIYK